MLIPFREKLQPAVPGQPIPVETAALIGPRKHEKAQSRYHQRYMMTSAIFAKARRCKPNRRSCGYRELKQGLSSYKSIPSSQRGSE